MSKKDRILKLLKEGKAIGEVAKAVKVKPGYVYYIRWMNQKTPSVKAVRTARKRASRLMQEVTRTHKAIDAAAQRERELAPLRARDSKLLQSVKQMDRELNNIKPDKKAEAWAKKNPWFGVSKPKTAYALGLHEELVRSGVDAKSDEYWKRVDEGMSAYTKPLTTTQKAIAKKLGLTNNQYPTTDLVNHPPHYKTGGIETIDFIEAKDLNYRLGNVVKYVSRAGKKLNADPVQDLEKAAFYLQREIEARKSA